MEPTPGFCLGVVEPTTVLVTGATSGIGLHTASNLVKAGHRVLVHGRSPHRTAAAVERLRRLLPDDDSRRQDRVPDGIVADLSSFHAVRCMVHQLKARPQIDILLNNAAVFQPHRGESADANEMTLAVNVLAPMLLTSLLLPGMLKSCAPDGRRRRIVNVSSISHMGATAAVPLANLQQTKGRYSGHAAYSLSKLLVIFWTYELAEMVATVSDCVSVNTLDPGTVNTDMLLQGWGPIGIPVEAANDETKLCIDSSYEHCNGLYFVNGRKRESAPLTYDKGMREKVWRELETLSGANHDYLGAS